MGSRSDRYSDAVVPGFLPTPAGDLVEYAPSWIEFLVSLGIWAMGAFLFTVMAKVALAIQAGLLRHPSAAEKTSI